MYQDRMNKEQSEKNMEGCVSGVTSLLALVVFFVTWSFLAEFIRLAYVFYGGVENWYSTLSIYVVSMVVLIRFYASPSKARSTIDWKKFREDLKKSNPTD